MSNLTITGIQANMAVGDLAGNAAKIIAGARAAHEDGAQLAVTSELAVCGYPPEDLILRDDFLAQCEQTVMQIAKDVASFAPNLTLLIGAPRLAASTHTLDATGRTRHNSVALCRNGEILRWYDKQLLPTYGVFDEGRYFTAGTDDTLVDVDGTLVGISVCEDLWADHGPTERQREQGAELLVVLNASPWSTDKVDQREQLCRRRSTGTALIYVNQVGGQDELTFDGRSAAYRDGTCVARAAAWTPDTLHISLDTPPTEVSGHAGDALDDVRRALVTATRDYVTKAGFRSVVLGLSGGIDSAVTAAIAVEALGAEQVTGVLMPSPHSSQGSIDDAEALATNLGIKTHTLPIGPLMATADATLNPLFEGSEPDVTEENIQARLRGMLLMAISNKHGHLLLTTGNKSETAVGYMTLYGDMAGGYAPLQDLPKLDVYRLAEHINAQAGRPVIPTATITKPPSAELAPDQRDGDSLPDYKNLDSFVSAFVEQDLPLETAAALSGLDIDEAARMARLIIGAEHKRRQAPPGPKITPRNFRRDRRYPLVNRWTPTAASGR